MRRIYLQPASSRAALRWADGAVLPADAVIQPRPGQSICRAAKANKHPEWEPDIRRTFARRWVERVRNRVGIIRMAAGGGRRSSYARCRFPPEITRNAPLTANPRTATLASVRWLRVDAKTLANQWYQYGYSDGSFD